MFKKTIEEPDWIPFEDFLKAYFDCRKRKRGTVNALKFEINYERNLVKLWKDVNQRKYKIGKSITFVVTRPKDREVFAADFRDRVVHHVIMQRLEPLFEADLIEDCYSCRNGKGTLYGVQRLAEKIKEYSQNYTKECWVGKFDLKGFFMSIRKSILCDMLEDYIKDKYKEADQSILIYLIKKIVLHRPQNNCIKKSPEHMWNRLPKNKSLFFCDPDCGIAIGNLTSQIFANFYLNAFDHMMSKLFNGNYGRYVDDFYVIHESKEYILGKLPEIKTYLWNNLKLKLNENKIYIQKYQRGVKFIGSVVKKDRIYLGNVTRAGLYSAIHKYNIMSVSRETAIEFANTLNSYLGFMRYTKSYKIKLKIKSLIDRKWYGFFYWSKDMNKIILTPYYNNTKKAKQDIKNKNIDNYFK